MAASNSAVPKWAARLQAFEELCNKWRSVGLTALQRSSLDADALEIATGRELTIQNRKELSQATREFAKIEERDEKLVAVGPLVKQYQMHVDEITRFSKITEKAFFRLHEAVKRMTDPFPLMEKFCREKSTILDFIQLAEETNTLKETLSERESELLELKNQEVTIQKLREQLAVAEMGASSKAEETAHEASAELQSLVKQWQQRENAVQQELYLISQENRKLQFQHNDLIAQLDAARVHREEIEMARDHDLEQLTMEIDSVQVELSKAQREIERLKSGAPSIELFEKEEDDLIRDVMEAREEIQNLRKQCSILKSEREMHLGQLQELRQLTQQSEVVDQSSPQQLAEWESKCTDLEKQNALLFSELQGLQAETGTLRSTVHLLETANCDLKRSVTQLEKELQLQDQTPALSSDPLRQGTEETVVFSVAAQRDRYRQRLITLEEVTSQEIDRLRTDVATLQKENQQLHEHLRYSNSEPSTDYRAIRIFPSPAATVGVPRSQVIASVMDRSATVISQAVLTSQPLRRIFFLYLAILHSLVLFTLLRTMLTELSS